MARRKKESPEVARVREKLDKARADFEKWYTRTIRSFNALNKAKKRVKRLADHLRSKVEVAKCHEQMKDIPL